MKEIVSVHWLNENLTDKDLIILDSTIQSVSEKTNFNVNQLSIPGVRFFDLKNAFSDNVSKFPNTVPSQKHFEFECKKLGINKNSKVVVFDEQGVYSSPRVWWLFKVMNHHKVSVLDGGLPEWEKFGFPLEKKALRSYTIGNFEAEIQSKFIKTYQEVVENLTLKKFIIIDARSNGRFNGTDREPRKYLKSGHIPDSINIPFQEVLEKGKFKSKRQLKKLFEQNEIDDKDVVYSCGSGLTACIVLLASKIVDKISLNVYDGSWTEWAELQNLKEDEKQNTFL